MDFEVADHVVAYVANGVLNRQKPGTRKFRFYLINRGMCWLEFAEPWRGRGAEVRED